MIKLSTIQRVLIAHRSLDAHSSLKELSRQYRVQEHRLRYAYQRLISDSIIEPRWIVDSAMLGWSRYTYFIAIDFSSMESRKRFIAKTIAHDRIAFFAELRGTFDFEISMTAQTTLQAQKVFDSLPWKEVIRVRDCMLLPRVVSRIYPRSYLSPNKIKRNCIKLFGAEEKLLLSTDEISILNLLSSQNSISQRALATQIGRSLVYVNHAIQRLTEAHVLKGNVLEVHGDKFGAFFYTILVKLAAPSSQAQKLIEAYALECEYVTHLVSNLGSWDYELGVEMPNEKILLEIKMSLLQLNAGKLIGDLHVIERALIRKFNPFPGF